MNESFPTLSLGERDRRWATLRSMMTKKGFECLIAFGLKGREHFEGYIGNEHIEGLAILPRESEPALVTWHPKMVIRRMNSKTDQSRFWVKDVRIGKYGPEIVKFLKERGLDRARIGVVALEAAEANGSPEGLVPYPLWKAVIEGVPHATFEDVTFDYREIMLVKSGEELTLVRYCGNIGERACEAMVETVKVGATEFEIYHAIQGAIHSAGAVCHDPFLIMTWGKDDVGWSEPAWTYYGGPPRLVEPGDLIMAELFPAYGGLETQQQMSVAVAPVEPLITELAEVARSSYMAGLKTLRAGVTFESVLHAMLVPLRKHGGWALTPMLHSVAPLGWIGGLGHNLHQMPEPLNIFSNFPSLFQQPELVLREGMTFAFEPNACSGQRRVNVGGTVVVGKDQPEELNRLANRLYIIG